MILAKIPKNDGEYIRKKLFKLGLVRKDYKIFENEDFIYLPLRELPDDEIILQYGFTVENGSAEDRSYRKTPQELIAEDVDIDEKLKVFLPQKWEKLGSVAIIKIPEELEDLRFKIAPSYAKILGAECIVRERSHISGIQRIPDVEILYGTNTETVHFENGIYYKLDVSKLMFSSGNIDEKLRMSSLDCTGETIVDMFAGIGYFTLPLAVHANAHKIIACEINPVSYNYLNENILLNNVQDIVCPILGDNNNLEGSRFADRIIMGYVHTTHQHLRKAFDLIKTGGIIHYHDTYPLEIFPDAALENIKKAAGSRKYSISHIREVKSYSPGVSHMVMDITVEQ